MPDVSKKILDDIYIHISALQRRIEGLENNTAPTLPIYDSSNWPQDAVEGQVVVAPNGAADTLWIFRNGAWQNVSGDALIITDGFTTINPTNELRTSSGLVLSDLGSGVASIEVALNRINPPIARAYCADYDTTPEPFASFLVPITTFTTSDPSIIAVAAGSPSVDRIMRFTEPGVFSASAHIGLNTDPTAGGWVSPRGSVSFHNPNNVYPLAEAYGYSFGYFNVGTEFATLGGTYGRQYGAAVHFEITPYMITNNYNDLAIAVTQDEGIISVAADITVARISDYEPA